MSDATRDSYSEAANRAVTPHERLGLWTVYPYYEVRDGRGGYAVAPRNVPEERVRKVGSERGRGVYVAEAAHAPANDRRHADLRRVRRRTTYSAEQQEEAEGYANVGNDYMPLRDFPALFGRFARLADRGEVRREDWLGWLHEYGVLGVLPSRTGRYQRNETTDSFSRFSQEALLANRALKLFEAVTADKDGPEVEAARKLLPEDVGDDPDRVERAALWAILDTIEEKTHADCHERLKPRDTGAWRKKNTSPFVEGWVFGSLLGAMWLQFKWLVKMDGLRYCEIPGCNGHISPHARIDKVTCGDRCRQRKHRKS